MSLADLELEHESISLFGHNFSPKSTSFFRRSLFAQISQSVALFTVSEITCSTQCHPKIQKK